MYTCMRMYMYIHIYTHTSTFYTLGSGLFSTAVQHDVLRLEVDVEQPGGLVKSLRGRRVQTLNIQKHHQLERLGVPKPCQIM